MTIANAIGIRIVLSRERAAMVARTARTFSGRDASSRRTVHVVLHGNRKPGGHEDPRRARKTPVPSWSCIHPIARRGSERVGHIVESPGLRESSNQGAEGCLRLDRSVGDSGSSVSSDRTGTRPNQVKMTGHFPSSASRLNRS